MLSLPAPEDTRVQPIQQMHIRAFFRGYANMLRIIPWKDRLRNGALKMCLSSIILSPLNGNVKMSPYEQGDICIEPERATTSGGDFQMREGGVGVCQGRRTPVSERAPNQTLEEAFARRRGGGSGTRQPRAAQPPPPASG